MEIAMRSLIPLLVLTMIIAGCGSKDEIAKNGKLEITFTFNKAENENIEPSYQLAVWLEDEKGKYVETLQLADYLSYGGYNDTTICPAWLKHTNWDTVSMAKTDAVTRATPPVGLDTLLFDINLEKYIPGTYQYCIQAHIIENYNIQYIGKIKIGKQPDESTATANYTPRPYKGAESVLADVKATYLY